MIVNVFISNKDYWKTNEITMKKLVTLLLLSSQSIIFAQESTNHLGKEMQRLKVETALIVHSQAIDEQPLWSPDGLFIACNIAGKWYKYSLKKVKLMKGKWINLKIGVLDAEKHAITLADAEVKEYYAVSPFNIDMVETKGGTKIEVKISEMETVLYITKKGGVKQEIWTTGGQMCHSLVLSPDEKYVAYLCELNGLMVTRLK